MARRFFSSTLFLFFALLGPYVMADPREYDFIIVGGGTAGLVVANRLSADPTVSVLVLEAGGNNLNDSRSVIPALWQSILTTELDWNYATKPQSAVNDRVIAQPQGRTLGGSSAINGLAFIPPSAVGIDEWRRLGNEGWDWETLKPYYKKSRNLTYPDHATSEYLGLDDSLQRRNRGTGPVQASFVSTLEDPLPHAWTETFKALGWSESADPFSGKVTGGFTNAVSIDFTTKTRSHSGVAYYLPAQGRPNLHLQTGAYAEKIILQGTGKNVIARGVQYKSGNETFSANARNEVILAAGAYGSPKLLELSGIGSPDVLEPLGIDVVVHSPHVGDNLQDHVMTGISYEVVDGVKTLDDLRRGVAETIAAAMAEYQQNRSGPFTLGGIGSFAVMPVLDFLTDEGKDELKKLLKENAPANDGTQPIEQEYFDFVKKIVSSEDEGSGAFWMTPVQGAFGGDNDSAQAGNYLTIGITPLHPFSRGHAHISSSDPTAAPTIDPGYLQNALDLEVFARHMTFIESLAQTSPLRDFIKDPINGKRNIPQARATTLDEARNYAKLSAISNWHPVGTCVMLPKNKGGVVGANLKVHGVRKGLRIVDSSIMPVITRGNPQTTVYAVAERAADLILREYSSV